MYLTVTYNINIHKIITLTQSQLQESKEDDVLVISHPAEIHHK